MNYFVYILECADGTYYTGVTNDLDKRIHAHNNEPTGAKYTKARRPVALKYSEPAADRSEAQKRECAIKKLSRLEKNKLFTN